MLTAATRERAWSFVTIAATFGVEHPPLLTEELWVRSNCTLIAHQGARAWLTTLLRVLGGDIVTADDVANE